MNNEEIDESPYCEVCGTCGYIGCCGIRNFISEHIEGKTNCKNEGWIIQELINLCEYKDEVFKENERLNNIIEELDYLISLKIIREANENDYHIDVNDMVEIKTKLYELKEKSDI